MNFGDLYSYSTKNGVVVPNTDGIRDVVVQALKNAFEDQTLSTDPETPQGRIIEAITLLFVDVLRVCAMNANGFNPSQAVGTYLDNIGALFGVQRGANESDYNYRNRIIESNSTGSGYALSVRRAISQVSGVTSICVLDNGKADPAVLPNSTNGIAVGAHSVFICVGGGDDMEIAEAIFKTLSAGCAFETSSEYGTVTTKVVADDQTNTSKSISFYRPESISATFAATVRDDVYTGIDIVQDTKNAIADFVNNHSANYTITKGDIVSAIAAYGTGIVCTDLVMTSDGTPVNSLVILPYKTVSVDPEDANQITVDVI